MSASGHPITLNSGKYTRVADANTLYAGNISPSASGDLDISTVSSGDINISPATDVNFAMGGNDFWVNGTNGNLLISNTSGNGDDAGVVGSVDGAALTLKSTGTGAALSLKSTATAELKATTTIEIQSTTSMNIEALTTMLVEAEGITLENGGTATNLVLEYDKDDNSDTALSIKQNAVDKLIIDSSGDTLVKGIGKYADGNSAAPSIAWESDSNNGLYNATTFGDAVGVTVNQVTGLVVNYDTGTSSPVTNVYNASGQAYLNLLTTNAHGSATDISSIAFIGMNSTPTSYVYSGISNYCINHTAASEESRLDFKTSSGGSLATRMSISGENVGIGTTDFDGTPAIGKLIVKGSTNDGSTNIQVWRDSDEANVAYIDTDGYYYAPPGTESDPAIKFFDDTGLGLYRIFNDYLGISCNSVLGFSIGYNGSLSAPTTTVYNGSGDAYLFVTNGSAHGVGDICHIRFFGQNATPSQCTYGEIEVECETNGVGTQDGIVRVFATRNNSQGGTISIGDGVWIGTSASDPGTDELFVVQGYSVGGQNAASCGLGCQWVSEEVTIAVGQGAGGVATSGNLAPANSLIWGVTVRCTDAAGGGATNYDVGITGSGNADELIQNAGVSLGNTAVSPGGNDGTQLPIANGSATTLTITTDSNVTVDDMKVRIVVYYSDFSASTS